MLKYSVLIIVVFFNCHIAFAQDSNQAPLSFEIKLANRTSKEGRKVFLAAMIKNISDQTVAIDKNSLGYAFSFLADRESYLSQAETGMGYAGNYAVLAPKEKFVTILSFDLTNEFFELNPKFRMQIIYGQFSDTVFSGIPVWRGVVKSNELKFVRRNGKLLVSK